VPVNPFHPEGNLRVIAVELLHFHPILPAYVVHPESPHHG
jgi:hypothetical protein